MPVHTTPHAADLTVTALASGSSGNAFLVQTPETAVLIDAGVPLNRLAPALRARGVSPGRLNGILLTHEHTDHAGGAPALARRHKSPIISNAATLAEVTSRDDLEFPSVIRPTGGTFDIGDLTIRSFPIPHDAVEPVGYVIGHNGRRIALLTDVGSVTDAMREAVRGVDLLIVEANHDVEWLWRGPYTQLMKQRISSPLGHLSNAECAELVAWRLELDGPCTVWLAHISRVNNSSSLARRSVTAGVRAITSIPFALDVALRDQPSVVWTPRRSAVQLTFP